MNTRKFSNVQEKVVAKKLGGKKNSNSGATPFIKGDVQLENFLIECKTTTQKRTSISIKEEWLIKLKQEAFAMNKPYRMLAFNFGPGEKNFYIVDENLIKYVIDLINKEENRDDN